MSSDRNELNILQNELNILQGVKIYLDLSKVSFAPLYAEREQICIRRRNALKKLECREQDFALLKLKFPSTKFTLTARTPYGPAFAPLSRAVLFLSALFFFFSPL